MKSEIIDSTATAPVHPRLYQYNDGAVFLITGPRGGTCIVGSPNFSIGRHFDEKGALWEDVGFIPGSLGGRFLDEDITVKFTSP